MTAYYTDQVFAPLDLDHALERLAGGNETEVYRTDDGRHVVKLKGDIGGTLEGALADARAMQTAANQFAACLGPRHSIPSHYAIARDNDGRAQVLVVQPLLRDARALHDVDYAALTDEERRSIAAQLREIVRRSLAFYRATGSMPDLYGRSSSDSAERARLNGPLMLPWRLWSFFVERNLLRSHNLMLTAATDRRVVLVDYDAVRRSQLYRRVYYLVRWFLFWRDHALILIMRKGQPTQHDRIPLKSR
jgi:hypothetical protein